MHSVAYSYFSYSHIHIYLAAIPNMIKASNVMIPSNQLEHSLETKHYASAEGWLLPLSFHIPFQNLSSTVFKQWKQGTVTLSGMKNTPCTSRLPSAAFTLKMRMGQVFKEQAVKIKII